jgi:hypothetical protein
MWKVDACRIILLTKSSGKPRSSAISLNVLDPLEGIACGIEKSLSIFSVES